MPDKDRWLNPLYNGLVWRLELRGVPDVFNEDVLWNHEHSGHQDATVVETTSGSNRLRLMQALEKHRRWIPGRTLKNGRVEEVWKYFTDVILCISQKQWNHEQLEYNGERTRILIQNLVSKHRRAFPSKGRWPRYSVRPDSKLADDQVVFFFGKGVYLPAPKEIPTCNVLPALDGVLNQTVTLKIWELPIQKPGPQPVWWRSSANATEFMEEKQGELKVLEQPVMFYDEQDCFLCTPEGQGPLPIPGWQAPEGAFLLIRKDGDDNWLAICDDDGHAENCPPAPMEKKWVFRRMPKSLDAEIFTAVFKGSSTPLAGTVNQLTNDTQQPDDQKETPATATTTLREGQSSEGDLTVDQLLSLELTPRETKAPDAAVNQGRPSIIGQTLIMLRNIVRPVRPQQQHAPTPYTIELEGINIPNLAAGVDQLTVYLTRTGSLVTAIQIKCALRDKIGLNRFISIRHNATVSVALSMFGRPVRQWQYAVDEPYNIRYEIRDNTYDTGALLLPPISPGQAGLLKFSNSAPYTYPLSLEPRTLGRTDPADPQNAPNIALDQLAQPWSLFGEGQVIYNATIANSCLSRYHAVVWIKDECLMAEPVRDADNKYKEVTLLHLDQDNRIKPTTTMPLRYPLRLEDGDGLMAGYALLRFRVQK